MVGLPWWGTWLAGALVMTLGVAWSEGSVVASDKGTPGHQAGEELVIHGFYLEEFEEEGRRLELWADRAFFLQEEERFYLQGVRILGTPVEKGGGRRFQLTGREGVYDLKGQTAEVSGEVRVISEDGYSLVTDKVFFDYRTRRIQGPGTVLVEGPEGSTQGVGLEADLEREVVILQDRVRTAVRPSTLKKAKEVLR